MVHIYIHIERERERERERNTGGGGALIHVGRLTSWRFCVSEGNEEVWYVWRGWGLA